FELADLACEVGRLGVDRLDVWGPGEEPRLGGDGRAEMVGRLLVLASHDRDLCQADTGRRGVRVGAEGLLGEIARPLEIPGTEETVADRDELAPLCGVDPLRHPDRGRAPNWCVEAGHRAAYRATVDDHGQH